MRILLFNFAIFTILLSSCVENNTNLAKTKANKMQAQQTAKQVNFIGQWRNEGKREALIHDFVREYEFKNQHIDINLKFPEEVYYDRSDVLSDPKFIINTVKQSIPDWDIIRVNGDYAGTATHSNEPHWPSKYLVDFSQFPEFLNYVSPQVDLNKVKEKWDGIIPGPILEGQYYALWVNKKVAKKIGIEVKQYGMTFDDFLSYVKAANEYNKSSNEKIAILHDVIDWSTITPIVLQLYGSLINDPTVLANPQFNQIRFDAWKKALYALEELSKYNLFSEESNTITWYDSRFDLPNEKCLFYSNGSWMFNIWDEEDSEATRNCVPCEYPVFNPVQFYPGAFEVMWAVPKSAPNKKEAIDFLIAMNNPTMADMWVRYTKSPTGIKGNVVGVNFGTDLIENFSKHVQDNYGTNLYYVRESGTTIFGNDFIDITGYNHKTIMRRERTAQEVISELEEFIANMGSANSIVE